MKLIKNIACWIVLSAIIFINSEQLSAQDNNDNQMHLAVGADLPELKIRNYFGVQFSELDIIEDRNFVVFLFNPTCYHCVEMTEMFIQHEDELSETTVFFIAAQDMLEILPKFLSEVKYKESPNLIIGVDDSDIVRKLYNSDMLPQILIYNSEKKLIKIHNGEWTWDSFKEFVK